MRRSSLTPGGGSSPLGLARQELGQVTSDDASSTPPDVSDPNSKLIIAPEVKSLQFQYFDGSNWQDTWDGTQAGSDGVTPIGPPAAVAITVGVTPPGGSADQQVRTYRHVVAILTANGPTAQQSQDSSSTSP
jgi:hypothetical protein